MIRIWLLYMSIGLIPYDTKGTILKQLCKNPQQTSISLYHCCVQVQVGLRQIKKIAAEISRTRSYEHLNFFFFWVLNYNIFFGYALLQVDKIVKIVLSMFNFKNRTSAAHFWTFLVWGSFVPLFQLFFEEKIDHDESVVV